MAKKAEKNQVSSRKQTESFNNQKDVDSSRGLAVTHEQATDVYNEGTVDGHIDHNNEGKRKFREKE